MIFIGLGSNQPSKLGPPQATLEVALGRIAQEGGRIVARSRFYKSAPVPASTQPWYVNAVAALETRLPPEDLLILLHRIETELGRVRREKNEPRGIDLDLLAYDGFIRQSAPILPHPRMHERAFVLLPLAEIAPGWIHPGLGVPLEKLIAKLPPGQIAEPIKTEAGAGDK
jgi:2-amino-4-hydroxy-6-hydroxymethyldihydropteridine diphosphokinase